jgi:hypothetical protein
MKFWAFLAALIPVMAASQAPSLVTTQINSPLGRGVLVAYVQRVPE